LLVDCVTSLAGIATEIDLWEVDLAYSGSQKCLGVPPGLAPFTVSPQALERVVDRPRSWYLDVNMIARYVTGEGARAYHHTAPISMIYALHGGLGAVQDEGLDEVYARHAACGEVLHAGLEERGFELFAAEGHRLPQLTTVWVPQHRLPAGTDEADVRRSLLRRYGIEIGGGLGEFAGRVWRIGCMGHTARLRNVRLLLAALDEVLEA
jgi:alanine-glyoxylate transaminase/serine-glyoxylate transaminase/serine-pyruvate transaminase